MEFKNRSEEIRYYVVKLLEDYSCYGIAEIKSYIEKESGNKFGGGGCYTDSMLAGVLNRLVKKGGYTNNKGSYTKDETTCKPEDMEDINAFYHSTFKEAIAKVSKKIKKLPAFDLTLEDFQQIQEIKDTIDILEKRLVK